jgi:putative endonuclease
LSKQRIELGKTGEDIAATYLQQKGLTIITRNYRDKFGEIDIIAGDDGTIVFVEVKTRRSDHFGLPEEAVTAGKQQQIIRVANNYLARRRLLDEPARFDVIAIIMKPGTPEINHLVSAFETG